MKLKLLDKNGLIIIFIIGGMYGFTDFNSPKDAGTFIGSAIAVMLLSMGAGWIINKVLRLFNQYKQKSEKLNNKISPTILIALVISLGILISGSIE